MKKKTLTKRLLSILLSAVMVLSLFAMGPISVSGAAGDAVSIPDSNLKAAICDELGIQYTEDTLSEITITEAQMESMTKLIAPNKEIKDLTGLYKAVNLVTLDLSGNPLGDAYGMFAYMMNFNFSAFSKLQHLNMSNCKLGENVVGNSSGGVPGISYYQMLALGNLKNIVTLDLSDNGLTGLFNFYYNGRFEHLTSLDFSGNRLNSIGNFDLAKFPALENFDISDNYLYWDESAGSWIEPLMQAGEIIKHENQKNNADLFSIQQLNKTNTNSAYNYLKINNEDETITLNDFSGETKISFLGFAMELTTKVTVGDNKVTAATINSPGSVNNDNMVLTLSGYAAGTYEEKINVMHLGGDAQEYTLKFTVTDVPASDSPDSAGIKDSYLQELVCAKLGQPATTYVVTKADMASSKMGKSFVTDYITNAEGLQYATGLTSLTLKGTFTEVPDLSGLTSLTSLTVLSDNLEKRPDLSALTSLTSLTVTSGSDGFPDLTNLTELNTLNLDKVGTHDYPKGLSNTIKKMDVLRANGKTYAIPDGLTALTDFRFLPNTNGRGNATNEDLSAALDLSGIKNITDPSSLTVSTGIGVTAITGLSADSKALNSISFNSAGGTVFPEGLEEVPSLTGTLTIQNNTSGEIPNAYVNLTKVTKVILRGNFADVPTEISAMESLTSLDMDSCGIKNFTTDLSNTKLTNLNLWGGQLTELPSGNLLPETLATLTLTANLIKKVDDETVASYTKMKNLTNLELKANPLTEFPSELIKNLPALTVLSADLGRYTDIAADTFDNSTKLKTVSLGNALQVDKDAAGTTSFNEGTGGAEAIATLKEYQKNISGAKIDLYGDFTYSRLTSLDSSIGTINEDPFSADELSLSVPEGTESLTLTPDALLSDTVITVNGKEYKEGEAVTIDGLAKGGNIISISSYNDFQNYSVTNKTTNYTLNIFVGDYISEDFPADGHTYNVKYTLYKSGQDAALSMADGFFTKTSTVRYKDGRYEIQITTNKSSWIPQLNYYLNGELLEASLVSKDNSTDHATYRMYADSLEDVIVINPYVNPMGYAPKCDLRFNTQEIIDITDTLPTADTTDLNIALNEAIAISGAIYTDASYSVLTQAIEAAQKVLGDTTSTQDEVDEQTALLKAAIEGLEVDESKLANKTALNAAIEEAEALEKGEHTDTAYKALQEAISDAKTVYDKIDASQAEVDAQAKALKTAITLFQNSGGSSTLDKDNLEDGIYSVYGEMIKVNRTEYSMANDSISHNIKLEVSGGKYYVTLDFKGLAIESFFGYLGNLKYFAAGYSYDSYGQPQGEMIDTTVVSTQKNADGSDVIDKYNSADSLYPDLVKFPLVDKASGEFVPLQVFVPIMESIGLQSGNAGMGTQYVLLKLDWSSLKTASDNDFVPEETPVQSPPVDLKDSNSGVSIYADKGVLPEGMALSVNRITSGADYEKAVSALADVGKKFRLYDITLLLNGEEIQPNGLVKVSLPIPAGYDQSKLALYRINDDGSKTLISGSVENGNYIFYVNHFSNFALVEKGSTQLDTDIASTGDTSPLAALAAAGILSLLAGGTLVAAGRKRRTTIEK